MLAGIVAAAALTAAWPGGATAGVVPPNSAQLQYRPNPDNKGEGRVTSDPPGIDCLIAQGQAAGSCSFFFSWPATEPALEITLIETPAPGSLVCAKTCRNEGLDVVTGTVIENGQIVPFAGNRFEHATRTLTVATGGDGTGIVRSVPVGITCGLVCSAAFEFGAPVLIRAEPDAGSVFGAWSGACSGQGALCTLVVAQNATMTALFQPAGAAGGGGGGAGGGQPGGGQPGGGQPGGGQPGGPGDGEPGGGSGGNGPPGPADTPGSPGTPDRSVDADLVAVTTTERRGRPVVRIHIANRERLTGVAAITRHGRTLARASFAVIRQGDRVVRVPLPADAPRRPAKLRLTLADAIGNTRTFRRRVELMAARAAG